MRILRSRKDAPIKPARSIIPIEIIEISDTDNDCSQSGSQKSIDSHKVPGLLAKQQTNNSSKVPLKKIDRPIEEKKAQILCENKSLLAAKDDENTVVTPSHYIKGENMDSDDNMPILNSPTKKIPTMLHIEMPELEYASDNKKIRDVGLDCTIQNSIDSENDISNITTLSKKHNQNSEGDAQNILFNLTAITEKNDVPDIFERTVNHDNSSDSDTLQELDMLLYGNSTTEVASYKPSLMSMIATTDFDIPVNIESFMGNDMSIHNMPLLHQIQPNPGPSAEKVKVNDVDIKIAEVSENDNQDCSPNNDLLNVKNTPDTPSLNDKLTTDIPEPQENRPKMPHFNIKFQDRNPKPSPPAPMTPTIHMVVQEVRNGNSSYAQAPKLVRIRDKKTRKPKPRKPKKIKKDAYTQTQDKIMKASYFDCEGKGCNKNFIFGKRDQRIEQSTKNLSPYMFKHLLGSDFKIVPKHILKLHGKNERKPIIPHKVPTTVKQSDIPVPTQEPLSANNAPAYDQYNQQYDQTNIPNFDLTTNIVYGPNDYYNNQNVSYGYDPIGGNFEVASYPEKKLIPNGAFKCVRLLKKDDIKRIGRFQDLYDHPFKKKLIVEETPEELVNEPVEIDPIDEPMDESEDIRAQEEALFGSVLSDDEEMSQCSSGSAKFSDDESDNCSTATTDIVQDQNEFDEDIMDYDVVFDSAVNTEEHYDNTDTALRQVAVASDEVAVENSDISMSQNYKEHQTNQKKIPFEEICTMTPLEMDNNDMLDFDEAD